MNIRDKVYIAGHTGLVGSAIVRQLKSRGFSNLLVRTHDELDLINQAEVNNFFFSREAGLCFFGCCQGGGDSCE